MIGDSQTIQRKKDMVEALNKCCGIVSTACEKAGISRRTHYNWIEDDPEYKKAWLQSKRGAVDLAESTLHKEMKEGGKGAVTAAIFLLKTLGKDQGYIERQEVEVTEVKPPIWLDGTPKE